VEDRVAAVGRAPDRVGVEDVADRRLGGRVGRRAAASRTTRVPSTLIACIARASARA
jgi:hypothetical protein